MPAALKDLEDFKQKFTCTAWWLCWARCMPAIGDHCSITVPQYFRSCGPGLLSPIRLTWHLSVCSSTFSQSLAGRWKEFFYELYVVLLLMSLKFSHLRRHILFRRNDAAYELHWSSYTIIRNCMYAFLCTEANFRKKLMLMLSHVLPEVHKALRKHNLQQLALRESFLEPPSQLRWYSGSLASLAEATMVRMQLPSFLQDAFPRLLENNRQARRYFVKSS